MPSEVEPQLTPDEIDDLLYFTRVDEQQDLQQTIVELAGRYNCTSKQLLEAAVDPTTGNTVLHFSSANGFENLLRALLSQLRIQPEGSLGAESNRSVQTLVNHKNKQGNTPLHWAAYTGHLEVVKLLVAAGADMWIKNSAGNLAMYESENAGKIDVAQYLAAVHAVQAEESTPGKLPTADEVATDLGDDEVHVANRTGQADDGAYFNMGEAGPSD